MTNLSSDLATHIRLILLQLWSDPGALVTALDLVYKQAGRLVDVHVMEGGDRVFVGGADPDEVGESAAVGNLYVELEAVWAEGWRLTPEWQDGESNLLEDTLWKLAVIDEENSAYRASMT